MATDTPSAFLASDLVLPVNIATCLLRSWVQSYPEFYPNLFDIEVSWVMHNKMSTSPEHEFLVIETTDKKDVKRYFILERTVGSAELLDNMAGVAGHGRRSLLQGLKALSNSTLNTLKMDSPTSMEEGSSNFSPMDKITLISTDSANFVSESSNKEDEHPPALDRLLGERHVYSKPWHGQNLRHFKPAKSLTLFELMVLANAAHELHPRYILLKEQCYFYSALIYSAIQHNYGAVLSNQNQDVIQSFGRWQGFKVSDVDHELYVVPLVKRFKEVYTREIADIARVSSSIFQTELTITNIPQSTCRHPSQSTTTTTTTTVTTTFTK